MVGPVFLVGNEVELRPIERDDADFLQEMVNNPDIWRTLARNQPISRAGEIEWIESLDDRDGHHLLITSDGDPIGTIGYDPLVDGWGVARTGYMIDPAHWNEGYATDALRCMVGYAFAHERYNKVVAQVIEGNEASARVLEKVGFTREGEFASEAYVEGEYRDLYRYGLLAETFLDR